jgi:hypothetical protein
VGVVLVLARWCLVREIPDQIDDYPEPLHTGLDLSQPRPRPRRDTEARLGTPPVDAQDGRLALQNRVLLRS